VAVTLGKNGSFLATKALGVTFVPTYKPGTATATRHLHSLMRVVSCRVVSCRVRRDRASAR
jgi:hypothetical protein